MKISENWLREWVNPDIDANMLCDQLTMAGLEVTGRERAGSVLTGVVVGEIVSVAQHPNADKLNLCQVSDGNQTLPGRG